MEALSHVTKLHKVVLSWDYFELYDRNNDEETSAAGIELPAVAQTYSTTEEYLSTFTPLLLEECAAQALREEEGDDCLATRVVVADAEQKGDFLCSRFVMDASLTGAYVDNDLVLVTKDNPESESGWEAVNTKLHCLGLVEGGAEARGTSRVRFYLRDEAHEGNAGAIQRVALMRTGLMSVHSGWYMKKLCNLSTITREWVALQSVRRLPFLNDMLTAKVGDKRAQSLIIPSQMKGTMEKTYNGSQMAAIQSGLDGTAINLIQGPPGTGKTKTILGLLSIIMHAKPQDYTDILAQTKRQTNGQVSEAEKMRLWGKLAPWLAGIKNPRDEHPVEPDFALEGQPRSDSSYGLASKAKPIKISTSTVGKKNHVLVCAPSNSALDEIVSRLMVTGLMDESGKMFTPSIVRVGVNAHHSVKSVSLDMLVAHRLASSGKEASSKNRTEWDRLRLAILDEADIVASTLSFSGSGLFARMSRCFDIVVIDEAAQAVEPATFIPLVNGCRQVFLVGDPVQLPATVISTRASDQGYNTSLFKRLQTAGYPVTMLDTQYRMHPTICNFPSLQFYDGGLKNGPNVDPETTRDWHKFPCFGPFTFFDVDSSEHVPEGSTSLANEDEAALVLSICGELMARYPTLRTTPAIGVITPYKAQVKLIRQKILAAMGEETMKMIDVNSIDGFQGREKDIAIFSAVRGKKDKKGHRSIGFVADERRINVGLTRARASMLVVGNSSTLEVNEVWESLIDSARSRGCMYKVTGPPTDFILKACKGAIKPLPAENAKAKSKQPRGATRKHKMQQVDEDADEYDDVGELPASAFKKHKAAR